MDVVLQITAFVVTVLVLVSIHEGGHMFVARLLNVKVLRYAIGFGRPIWRVTSKKSGIEYVISWLPLGGYVKLLDEREGKVADEDKPYAFNRQSLWVRSAIVMAGPLTNLLFAVVAYWLMFSIGVKAVIPYVGEILPDSVAATAGMHPGEIIASVDGVPVEDWADVALATVVRMGEKTPMYIETRNQATYQMHQYELGLADWQISDLNPEPLRSLGIVPYIPPLPPIVDEVKAGSPAGMAGLKKGDHILTLNGKSVPTWEKLVRAIQPLQGKKVELVLQRGDERLNIPVTIGSKFVLAGASHQGYLGIGVKPGKYPEWLKFQRNYNVLTAWKPAWEETWRFFSFNFVVLKKMFNGEISLRSLGGPITIFRSADRAFKQGVIVFLGFLAIVSVMLAFVNVLPVPGLDGGHLLYFLVELILRRPLSLAAEILTLRIGMIMLVLLVLAVSINDILRLVGQG